MHKLVSVSAALALAFASMEANGVTIHFETTPNGASTTELASIGTTYSDYGVTFTDAYFYGCAVNGGCPEPRPGMFAAGLYATSTFSISFDGTTDAVTFSNLSYSYPSAAAFDVHGNELTSLYGPDYPATYTIAAPGIAKVIFTGPQFGVDDLTFELNSPAPEPASWALMLGGFGIVGLTLRGRRKTAFLRGASCEI